MVFAPHPPAFYLPSFLSSVEELMVHLVLIVTPVCIPPPFSFSTGCPSLTWPIMVWVQPAPVWPSACVFTLLCLPSVRLRAHLPSNACLCGRLTARTFLFGRRCVLLLWLWFQCFHLSGTTLKIHPPTHPRAETQRFTSGFITKILFYLLFFLIELIFLFKLFMFVFIWLTIPF